MNLPEKGKRRGSNLAWLVLVGTVAAAIPVVLYLTLTRERPQLEERLPVTTTAPEDLERLADSEPLYRDAVTATLGETPLIEAVDLRKQAGERHASVRRVQVHLSTFFTARKGALDNAWSEVHEALPPGSDGMRTERLILVLGSAHGAVVQLPEMAGEVAWEEGSVRVAGKWKQGEQACSAELTYTLHRGLLFVRYDCPGSRMPAEFLPADHYLLFDRLTVSSGSYVEVTRPRIVAGTRDDELVAADKLVLEAAAPLPRSLLAEGLPADRLAKERDWTVTLEQVKLSMDALAKVPLFGNFGTLPAIRFDARTASLTSSGTLVFEAPETRWQGVGSLKADQVTFATDGKRRQLLFDAPVLEEARWGMSATAPEATLERDGVGAYHLFVEPFTVHLPGNPLRLAALLKEARAAKAALGNLRSRILTFPRIPLPEWVPDCHIRLGKGEVAMPMGDAKVTNVTFEADVRGGTLEQVTAGVCMGTDCRQLGLGITLHTDSVGNPERVVLKAKGSRIAGLVQEQVPDFVQGLGNLDLDCNLTGSSLSGTYEARCQVGLEKLTLNHRRLAENPFTFSSLRVEGELRLDSQKKKIELTLPKLQVGGVYFRVALDVGRYDGLPQLKLKVDMPEQSCAALLAAVPERFAPELQDARLTGSIWFNLGFEVDLTDVRKTIKLDIDGDLERCDASTLGPRFDVSELNSPDYVHRVVVAGEDLGIDVGPGTPGYIPLMHVPKVVQAAAYGTEDLAFFRHNGFRLGLIRRAIILFLERGYYAYGGSTISQQLVKNLYLTRTKTLSRKFQEAVIVWKMEKEVSKERIFELYLNCIEYGPRIWGIAKAARTYFGKHTNQLNGMEAAFIMGLKPDPKYGYLQYSRGRLNKHWRKNLERVIKRLYDMGAISFDQYNLYMRSRLRFRIPGAVSSEADEDRPVRTGQEEMEEL